MDELKKKRYVHRKDRLVMGILVFFALVLFAGQAMAIDVRLFGKLMAIKGYANQMVQFGVAGDHYETKSGFQQAIMQALLELEYYPAEELKLFTTGMLYKDWAYNILDSDDDWEFRRFKESRNEMSLRTDYEDVLKECHISWTPGDFNLRVGKQIVVWGRMDGTRIMDQINPKDQRLGPSDVEFETSIIPIWLAKLEYFPPFMPHFLTDLGLEFIFNPNADFIPDKNPGPANYESGIWSVNAILPEVLNGRSGALLGDFEEPDKWSDGREYAFRIKGTFPDNTYFTLNFFKGVEDNPVIMSDASRSGGGIDALGGTSIPSLNGTPYYDDKGRQIIEPYMTGYYPDKKYAGFTFAKDFESLYIKALGGVAPLVRGEFIYEFDAAFTFNDQSNPLAPVAKFMESDAINWGLGVEWKFKWNLLNPRRYFTLMPQFMHRHIRDYPHKKGQYLQVPGGATVAENWYTIFCTLMTQYLHDKLTPMIVYMRDVHSDVTDLTDGSMKYDMWLFKLSYAPNHIWSFKTQLALFENDGNVYLRGTDRYDNISFTVQYQF